MMEVIYDEKNKKTSYMDRTRYELPKNIRQIGNAPGKYKIYIEDYVMTYLRKIASPGNTNCRGAILLGKVYDDDRGKVIFVSGAVDAQNLEFDISMIKFNDAVWSSIYSDINKYFDNQMIVGWFLSRMGFSADINEQMKQLHRNNFPGDGKLLFLMDSLECEEAFYYYDCGNLVRENGYYIYYVRNESMQNYIISRKNITDEAGQGNILAKDKVVVSNFRQKNEKKQAKNGAKTTMMAVAVCVLSLGTVWCVSPQTISKLGQGISAITHKENRQEFVYSGTSEDKTEYTNIPVFQDSGKSQTGKTEDDSNTDQGKEQLTDQSKAEENSQIQENSVMDDGQENTTDSSSGNEMQTYTVEAGDTLVSISLKMYGTQDEAENIARANDMDMETPIYEGQKLVIPYTNY